MKDFTKFICTLLLLIVLGPIARSQTFVHPGILHTQVDFDRMQTKVNAGAQPWKSGWDKLVANYHAQTSYNPNPIPVVYRGGSTQNFTGFMNDAAAAYQCALRWKISGETVYADKAVQILNAWAQTCKSIEGGTDASLAVGLQGFAFANAAEIVRDYNGWSPTDFTKYKKWMLDVFYAPASNYSLVTRFIENEILPKARQLGVAIVPYSVLNYGFLTGKMKFPLPVDDYRNVFPRFQKENLQHNLEKLAFLEQMAAQKGVSPGQLALAWALNQGEDIIPIVGMSSPKRITENIEALSITFTNEEMTAINTAFQIGAIKGDRYPTSLLAMVAS